MLWAHLNLSTYYALQSVLLNSLEQAFKQWDILASNPFADIMHQLHLHNPLVLQADNWYLAKHKERKVLTLRWGDLGYDQDEAWHTNSCWWWLESLETPGPDISGTLVEPWDDPKNLRHRVSGLSDRDAESITRDGLHFVYFVLFIFICVGTCSSLRTLQYMKAGFLLLSLK